MPRRHPLPRLWLMTDERMGDDGLWAALERLPRGAGVVFRHYGLPEAERRVLFARILKLAKRRRLVLLRAGKTKMRGESGAHCAHGPGLRTAPAHNRREAIAGLRGGAQALFVSPIFPTRSHPGARALGRVRLGLLIRGIDVPVIALGGMDARKAESLRPFGIHGWAAIDAWSR